MSLWNNGLHHVLDMMMIYFDMTRVTKGSCVGIPTALMTCVHSFFLGTVRRSHPNTDRWCCHRLKGE
jgi:hypothetical protein